MEQKRGKNENDDEDDRKGDGDASVADGERLPKPAAKPAGAAPGDSESGSAGSAR